MSTVRFDLKRIFGRRSIPHRVIIAKGDDIRTFTVRPWLAASLMTITVVFGGLYLAATAYLIYRDDLLAASLVSQARLRHAYEDRIAELRAQIDRVTSRQVVNQEVLDSKMEALLGRQAALDARQSAMTGLSELAKRAGIDLSTVMPQPVSVPAAESPTPLTTSSLVPAAGAVDAEGLRTSFADGAPTETAVAPDQNLAAVESSLASIEEDQITLIGALTSKATEKSRQISGVLDRLGVDIEEVEGAMGGPYEPIGAEAASDPFVSALTIAAEEVTRLGLLRHRARELPLSRPVSGGAITSRYGVRLDPFLKRQALHSGTDFRAALGQPIRATAAGTVTEAGFNGGYGNMVEVDHGDGIATRYAHMSRILVKVGDKVTTSTIVGKVGSTGRSTGAHLHYEVRIDGQTVDPVPYIRAGGELRGLL